MKYIIIFRSKSLLIITVLILGLSIQAPAAAGTFTTYKTNEANNSISEIPEKLFNRKPQQHDSSFAISADEVFYKLKQKQKITLIDVRNQGDFERLHIPGSVNIPLHTIKTKVFLKSFPVVLINEGFHYSPLQSECRQLTDEGFKAFILDGGLLAWKRRGSRLVGDLFALEDMKTVSPRIYLQEKDYENTLVIDISPVQTEISKQLMPYSRHLPVSADAREWVRILDRIIISHKKKPYLSILVFNDTGEGYEGLDGALADIWENTFYLQGGVAGYKQYLEDLTLSWRPRDNRIKTNSKCRTCSQQIEKHIITEVRQ